MSLKIRSGATRFEADLRRPSAPSQLLLDLYHKLYVPYATQGLPDVGHGQQSSRRPHHIIFGEPPDSLAALALPTATSFGSSRSVLTIWFERVYDTARRTRNCLWAFSTQILVRRVRAVQWRTTDLVLSLWYSEEGQTAGGRGLWELGATAGDTGRNS